MNPQHLPSHPTFDGDTRVLVARAARQGIPVGVVRGGFLHIVRNLDDLDQLDKGQP